jgi:DNA-binding LytR/AlgR family response regulator
MKCVVVEDEPKALRLLEEYIRQTPFLLLDRSFHHPLQALNYLGEGPGIDLVFLDINLPDLSGIDLARMIRPEVKIIFTTAYSDFAVRSYEVNTVDYMLKPVTYERFLQAAIKARKAAESEKSLKAVEKPQLHFFVKSGKKIVQVNWSGIGYIEALKEYMAIVTPEDKILVYKRMLEFESIMPESFIRVHNSFIINLDRIEKVEDQDVTVLGRAIPISRSQKDAFFQKIKDRLI